MLNFTLIKLSLLLIVGILLGFYFKFPVETLLPIGALILLLFGLSYLRSRRLLFPDPLFGIIVSLVFLFLGTFAVSLHLPANKPQHYIHHLPANYQSHNLLKAEVTEKLKPGLFQEKYIVSALELNGQPVEGKILLNVSRQEDTVNFAVGQKLVIAGELTPINSPLNPYQFNYSQYMEKLGVLRQLNVSSNAILALETNTHNLRAQAGNLRSTIINSLRRTNLKPEEMAIIQALLLGQRQEITQEMYSNYAAAGVIHILAVSGLHVGIILLILNRLFRPVERLWMGKLLKTLLLLAVMWGFAILAGLSPSVVRAVSMFSFVAIGMQLSRRTSVLNTLFASLLILLLINPGYISQVGFQLSYLAVFSIVLIQPHLMALYKGESRIIKYFWGILSVTIAAQIGVLPLSLFYFNQFPGLFFLSNIVILPFLGILLGLGILVMLLAVLNILPVFLAETFGKMISVLNQFVAWTASKEHFLFENIGFSLLLCLVFYLIVLAFILLLKDFRYKNLVFFLAAILIFQAALIYENFPTEETESLVFHKSRNTAIASKQGKTLHLFHDLDSPPPSYSFVKDYITHRDIELTQEYPLRNTFLLSGRSVLRIDSSGIYNVPEFLPEVILITNSPRLNMERLLSLHQPKVIVADGSNYPSFIKQWKKTAEDKKIPFHATGEKGAFNLSLIP